MKREHIKQRHGRLLEELTAKKTMQIAEILALLNVSDETLRKDLIAMEKQGLLRRQHGSVTLITEGGDEALHVRENSQIPAKHRIAEEALLHIPTDKAAIGLDSGNTVWFLSRLLAQRSGQTIVTNSLDSSRAFSDGPGRNTVYCTGGMLRDVDRAFYGPFAINCMKSMSLSVAVLGTGGVKNCNGIGAVSFDDREIKQTMRRQSALTMALLDSSKFDKSVLLDALPWEEVDITITDSGIRPEDREQLEKKTRLIVV